VTTTLYCSPPRSGLVDRVVHHHLIGVDGARTGPLADAQGVESRKAVRPQLDANADLAQLRRLLKHLDVKTLAHQRQGHRHAADAAAGQQHGKGLRVCAHRACLEGHQIVSTLIISIMIKHHIRGCTQTSAPP
jgi:hypothetical protein